MADEKLKFDTRKQVEEALKKSAVESDSKSTRLVTVVVVQSWSPTSLHVAKEIERIRKLTLVKSPIFLLDADADTNKTWDMNITATPALIFYLGGTPLTIRRSEHADDDKFVGSVSKENIMELFQSARSAENDGARIINADF